MAPAYTVVPFPPGRRAALSSGESTSAVVPPHEEHDAEEEHQPERPEGRPDAGDAPVDTRIRRNRLTRSLDEIESAARIDRRIIPRLTRSLDEIESAARIDRRIVPRLTRRPSERGCVGADVRRR